MKLAVFHKKVSRRPTIATPPAMTRPSVEAEKCLRPLLSIGLDVGYGATPAVPAAVPVAPVPVGYVPLYLLGVSMVLDGSV